MKLNRRTWNNVLIFSIILFIGLMMLPEYLRHKLSQSQDTKGVIALVDDRDSVSALYFPRFTLQRAGGDWSVDTALTVPAEDMAERWLMLSGTYVDEETLNQLKPSLSRPYTLEMERGNGQEPYRITYYQLPQFWLLQNGQGNWLAVSVESNYLFPLVSP